MLNELLLSYDENYVLEGYVEGMIGLKKKKNGSSKRKWKEIVSIKCVSKIKKVLSGESCRGVRVVMCCSLSCCQHFLCQMTRILRHKFWNKSFEEKSYRNPSLGLTTNVKVCKVAGQGGGPRITSHALESAKSVRE